MSDITPEKVAAVVCKGIDAGWRFDLEASLRVTAENNVLSLAVTRWDGQDDSENVRHFRAPVVEGETAPIVLERPKATRHGLEREGGAFGSDEDLGWQVCAYESSYARTCEIDKADSVLFRRGTRGVISPAEARRFAAALAALADQIEAAQAQKGGGDA